jgi:hypothetical protein
MGDPRLLVKVPSDQETPSSLCQLAKNSAKVPVPVVVVPVHIPIVAADCHVAKDLRVEMDTHTSMLQLAAGSIHRQVSLVCDSHSRTDPLFFSFLTIFNG